jgi:hypothetical protein
MLDREARGRKMMQGVIAAIAFQERDRGIA